MAPGVTISSSVDIASHVDVKRNVSVEAKEIVQLENLQYDNTLLLHHTSVTDDFDSLRFEAAAATQLVDTTKQDVSSQQLSHHLVSSPYNDSAHLLDLRRLTPQSLLFAKALTHLKPTRPDYATANYVDSLNFDEVLASLRNLIKVEQTHGDRTFQWKRWSFYVVVFRSVLKPDIDNDRLYLLDAKSHQEATESGGLLKYWFGKCSDERKNLATCKFCFSSFF